MNHNIYKCLNPKHSGSQIIFICMEQKCNKKRKCCIFCVDQQHKKHDIISIQKFLKQININIQKNNNHLNKQQIIKTLQYGRNQFIANLNSVKNYVNIIFSKIQSRIHSQINIIRQLLTCDNQQTIKNHIMYYFYQTDNVINQYIKLSQKASSVSIGSINQMKQIIEAQLNSFSQEIYNTNSQIKKSFIKVQKFLENLKLSSKKYQSDFIFSDINKSNSIELSDSKKTISRLIKPNNHTVCCFDKPIDPNNNKFFIKINTNPSKKLWLGLCLLDVVKKNNFMACSGLGKGTYAIDQSNGPSYSYNNPNNYATFSNHHFNDFNQGFNNMTTNAGWNFKQGDIMMVRLNYVDGQVGFYVINQDFNSEDEQLSNKVVLHSYQMSIKTNQGELYPFVGLNGTAGDQVTILTEQQIKQLISSFGNEWKQFDNISFVGLLEQDDSDDWW